MARKRKKTWDEKVDLVRLSYLRCRARASFAANFYEKLFFLNPTIKEHFKNTDFEHQRKAIISGMDFIMAFLDEKDEHARKQILRLSHTHAKGNLGIHPHHYYYWVEALIMTAKGHDPEWYDDLAYYWRECLSFPISFMVSQYFSKELKG